jgi:glyoxylase-like metal-dependent hydrolase (beta-lactamase superfamily II)
MALDHPWTAAPAPGRAQAVAPGVRWLTMPLPFKLDHINLWLLEDGAGFTVVDTGLGLPPTRALWEQVFAGELGGRPITRVIVTHFHPDHMGNAAWLTARWPADLWCTEAEWFAAHYAWRSRDFAPRLEHFRRHGLDDAALVQLAKRGNHYPGVVPEVCGHYRALEDGETLAIGGRAWRVLTCRGHAVQQACLWCPEVRVLISGDQVLPKITSNVSVWAEQPHGNPLRLYLDSLDRFAPLAADALVLPSHGLPFRGLHERLEALRAHHAARLDECADALTEPRTAAELIPVLFRRELDTHQLGFAVGETLAHLNHLEAAGRAVRTVGADGVHRFQKP